MPLRQRDDGMKQTTKAAPGRLRTIWAALTGNSFSISDGPGSIEALRIDSDAGVALSANGMLRMSSVWGCVRLISETLATLPLSMYDSSGGSKKLASQHPLHSILHDVPNSDTTAAVFWESMVAAMLLRGAGRAEKLMIGNRLVGLDFLDPERLTPHRRQGRVVREWQYISDTGVRRIIPAERVWTIPGFSLDGKNGVSVIRYGASVFGQAAAAEKVASRAFRNGALQHLYYVVKDFLQKGQRQDFRDNVVGLIETGQTPLLEGGIDVKALSISPKDIQLLESRSWSVEEICRWFRVPPWMVGHTEKSTSWGSGIEQQMIAFLVFTLAPWIRRIEQSISKDLLTPAERLRYYPKYAVEGLLRADSAARSAFYGVMVDKGILTRDEVRELEDREPMGGNAAVLTVQTAMTTLDSIGNQDSGGAARDALRDLLGLPADPGKT